jgi:hypothetical protein
MKKRLLRPIIKDVNILAKMVAGKLGLTCWERARAKQDHSMEVTGTLSFLIGHTGNSKVVR